MPKSTGSRAALATLLIALAAIVLFWGALVRGETFYGDDLSAYHRPVRSVLSRLLDDHGGLPQWNPYAAAGQPLAANPVNSVFHPLTTLYWLLPFELAFKLQVILPPLLSIGAMYFLLRTLGRSNPAALFAALSWGVGGYLLSTKHLHPIPAALVPLPMTLAFIVLLVRRRSPADLAGVALSGGVQLLSGEPSTLLATALLVPAALCEGWRGRERPSAVASTTLRLTVGLLLALTVGMAALLPGARFATKTVRTAGLSTAQANDWSMPPARVAELLSPRALGHVERLDDSWYWGRSLYPKRGYPYIYSLYAGLLTTLLAAVATLTRGRHLLPWLASGAVGLALAVGTHLPLWGLVRRLPLVASLRFPEKFVLVPTVALAVAAAVGFELLLDRADVRRHVQRALAALALLAASGVALAAIVHIRGAHELWLRAGVSPHIAPAFAATIGRDAAIATLTAATLLAGVTALGRRPAGLGLALLLTLHAADLVGNGRHLVPTKPVAEETRLPSFLAEVVDRPGLILYHAAAWDPRVANTYGLNAPPELGKWGLTTTLESNFELTQLRWTDVATRRFREAADTDPRLVAPLLARRGVNAVLTFPPDYVPSPIHTRRSLREAPLDVRWLATPQPPVFCAGRSALVDGPDGWLAAVRELGADARSAVLVEASSPGAPRELPAHPSGCEVEPRDRAPMRRNVTLTVESPGPAVVAINQTWDDGWQASLDGNLVPLLRADIALSAVVVPAGEHTLELRYRDPAVAFGSLLSALGLALCAGLLVVGRATRPQNPP